MKQLKYTVWGAALGAAIPVGSALAQTTGASPGEFITQIFNFAMGLGGFLAFGMIVWGGVQYTLAAGNSSAQSDAKDRIVQALLGLALLIGSVFILNLINPDIGSSIILPLSELEAIKPPDLSNPGGPGAGSCAAWPTGPASAANLANTCWGPLAEKASAIAGAESAGDPFAVSDVDRAQPGNEAISIGLFQINITTTWLDTPSGRLNCTTAFSAPYTGRNHNVTITNKDLYAKCVAAAKDPAINIANACRIYKEGGWGRWGANSKCGF